MSVLAHHVVPHLHGHFGLRPLPAGRFRAKELLGEAHAAHGLAAHDLERGAVLLAHGRPPWGASLALSLAPIKERAAGSVAQHLRREAGERLILFVGATPHY